MRKYGRQSRPVEITVRYRDKVACLSDVRQQQREQEASRLAPRCVAILFGSVMRAVSPPPYNITLSVHYKKAKIHMAAVIVSYSSVSGVIGVLVFQRMESTMDVENN
ncbi:unnamed protein product, partial [Ectocarpus sp. 8 AP-2014]